MTYRAHFDIKLKVFSNFICVYYQILYNKNIIVDKLVFSWIFIKKNIFSQKQVPGGDLINVSPALFLVYFLFLACLATFGKPSFIFISYTSPYLNISTKKFEIKGVNVNLSQYESEKKNNNIKKSYW